MSDRVHFEFRAAPNVLIGGGDLLIPVAVKRSKLARVHDY
jgi:hypothetical protein